MSKKQSIRIINSINSMRVEEYLIKNKGAPIAYAGGPRMISRIYDEGIELKSSKNNPWENEFNKEEVIIPKYVSKDITNKLIKLARVL